MVLVNPIHTQGWPEPYMYTVYDRIFSDLPAKNTVYTPCIYALANPTHTTQSSINTTCYCSNTSGAMCSRASLAYFFA